jgi:hypothetical protein
MIAPNTMISPCMVVSWLNSCGYIVPMSLWFVANTQRRQPCGAP